MEARRRLLRKPGCRNAMFSSKGDLEDVKLWKPDGIIAHIHSPSFLDRLAEFQLPIVNCSRVLENLPYPTVTPDNALIGQKAAEHLRRQGYEYFAYVGNTDLVYSRERMHGFQHHIPQEQLLPHFEGILPPQMSLEREDKPYPGQLLEWLRSLPPQTGVLASDDPTASVIVEALKLLNVEGNDRPGVVSGHDMDWPSDPPITAVEISNRKWGTLAGEMILNWIAAPGEQPPDHFFDPGELNERESTSLVATSDPLVLAAVQYIRDHADQDLAVPDVAAAVGRGRRTLERRFQEEIGHTVLVEINRAHVRLAKQLLRETNDAVSIVSRNAGLDDVNRLIRLFRKYEKMTPGKYRETVRELG